MMMNTELIYLAGIALITALMWVPYVTNMILVLGLMDAVGYPENPKPIAPWAQRMKNAHANAVENLVVFATLVLVAAVLQISNDITVMACVIYFWARVVHFVAYTAKIPWVRTLSFVAGFVGQVMLAWQILS
jgi:uncharacterized MAPEG superfamily protein